MTAWDKDNEYEWSMARYAVGRPKEKQLWNTLVARLIGEAEKYLAFINESRAS